MVYTSVVVILPLGSLVAQRIADPAAFSVVSSEGASSRSGGSSRSRFSFKKAFLHSLSRSDKDHFQDAGTARPSNVSENEKTMTTPKFSCQMQSNKIGLTIVRTDLEKVQARVDRESQQSEEVLWWNEQLRM